MHSMSLVRILSTLLMAFALTFGLAAIVIAHGVSESESRAKELAYNPWSKPSVSVPDGVPALNDASIKKAIEIYAIKMPKNVKGPYFNPKLEDRGLTIRRGVASDPVVYIGREAFSSWGLLGSTLAHEIEIHCRQNFLAIHFQNLAGFDGTGAAEREAYRYELANKDRFGLAQYDQDLIRSTMSYFYPEQSSTIIQRLAPVRVWLDGLAANALGVRAR